MNLSSKKLILVGITAFTSNINRAYEIARMYRKKKIKVIMGGIHISMLPDEALQYADSVVIGEVRRVSGIRSLQISKTIACYPDTTARESTFPKPKSFPGTTCYIQTIFGILSRPLVAAPLTAISVQYRRYLGKEYRQRKAKDVLDELEKIKGKYITFIDDNLIGYSPESRNRAIELFEGMIDLGLHKKWWMQSFYKRS